jgi:hypothetical protein
LCTHGIALTWWVVLISWRIEVKVYQIWVKFVNAGQFFLIDHSSIGLTFLICLCPLFLGMVKSAYILFVASLPLYKKDKGFKKLHRRRFSYTCRDDKVSPQSCGICCTLDLSRTFPT